MKTSKSSRKSPIFAAKRSSPVKRRTFLGLAVIGATVAAIWRVTSATDSAHAGVPVTLYKDPQCSCCEGYADYLRSNGFKVNIVPTHDLTILDDKYGIPTDLQPCHISLLAGYVVGGHVPVEVVNRLLAEKPKITGITLPGMPQGSPGMTGQKVAPFTIYVIGKGTPQVYAVV
ncbi:MAG: hypothetical protein KGJ66_08390 [Alphaproteobacteria bacterium]|nr:hypothetical protein [Alphaproteobacteria bacterium]